MTEQYPTAEPGVAVVGGPAPKGGDEQAPRPVSAPSSPAVRGRRRARTVAPRGHGTPTWVTVVFGVVALVAILVAVIFGSAWSNLHNQNVTRDTVKRVGTDFLTALTNFSPTTVDADFRTIATYATGGFAQQSNAFFGSTIRQQLEAVQAKSQGQIRYIYVQSLEAGDATLYAEVDQTFANSKVPTPQTDVLQVVLSLVDTTKGWKINNVSVLQPPAAANASSGNASSATGGPSGTSGTGSHG